MIKMKQVPEGWTEHFTFTIPWPFPPVQPVVLMQDMHLMEQTIIAMPDGTMTVSVRDGHELDVQLTTCPISMTGSGNFEMVLSGTRQRLAVQIAGRVAATNEGGRRAEQSIPVRLRPDRAPPTPVIRPTTPLPTSRPRVSIFSSSRAKIARAKFYLDDLLHQTRAYLSRSPVAIEFVPEEDGNGFKRIARVAEHVPVEIALTIGDVVHNLRVALDYLAIDIVRPFDPKFQNASFPFCGPAADLEEAMKKRLITKAPVDIANMIRALRPYSGGDEMLKAIQLFDNAEKHSLITPVTSCAIQPTFLADFVTGLYITRPEEHALVPVADDAVLDRHVPQSALTNDLFTDIMVAFDHNQPLAHKDVVVALRTITTHVEGIVGSFANRPEYTGLTI